MVDKILGSIGLVWLVVWVLAIIGWVNNILIIMSDFTTLGDVTGLMLVRIIGVFIAPIGAVLGWF